MGSSAAQAAGVARQSANRQDGMTELLSILGGLSRLAAFILGIGIVLVSAQASALAHSASSSYLTIDNQDRDLTVQWEIALRDLDFAIGIDSNGDGAITWGELRTHAQSVEAYALSRLSLAVGNAACPPGPVDLLADRRGDGTYATLRFSAHCPADTSRVTIHYALLFDIDQQHRGLVNFIAGGTSRAAALSPNQPDASFEAKPDILATLVEFIKVGIDHILEGADHLLFVAVLLLPAMFNRRRRPENGAVFWEPVPSLGGAFIQTAKILTAFTLAHALTLTLATLGYVNIPTRLSESGIALTIVATALDNIWPILPQRRWLVAFTFGLIHGLGFATALGPLALPPLALATALFAFNIGVEIGQLAVVALVLPLGFAIRRVRFYPMRLLPAASACAALIALAWFINRAFGVPLGI